MTHVICRALVERPGRPAVFRHNHFSYFTATHNPGEHLAGHWPLVAKLGKVGDRFPTSEYYSRGMTEASWRD